MSATFADDLHAARASVRRGRWDYWTKERIVEAGHEFARRYGRPPAAPDWEPGLAGRDTREERRRRYEADLWPGLSTVRYRFGRWSDFLRAAGFPVPQGGATGEKPRALSAQQELVLDVVREWAADSEIEAVTAAELAENFAGCVDEFDDFPAGNWTRNGIHQVLVRLERRGLVGREVGQNGRLTWKPLSERLGTDDG